MVLASLRNQHSSSNSNTRANTSRGTARVTPVYSRPNPTYNRHSTASTVTRDDGIRVRAMSSVPQDVDASSNAYRTKPSLSRDQSIRVFPSEALDGDEPELESSPIQQSGSNEVPEESNLRVDDAVNNPNVDAVLSRPSAPEYHHVDENSHSYDEDINLSISPDSISMIDIPSQDIPSDTNNVSSSNQDTNPNTSQVQNEDNSEERINEVHPINITDDSQSQVTGASKSNLDKIKTVIIKDGFVYLIFLHQKYK